MKKIAIALVSIGLLIGLAFLVVINSRDDASSQPIDQTDTTVASTQDSLSAEETVKFVRAISNLENIEPEVALSVLNELLAKHPKNAAFLQNKAIALVTQIKVSIERLGSVETKPEQIDALKSSLPGLFTEAEETIKLAQTIEPQNESLAIIDVVREQYRIARLPSVLGSSLNKTLAEKILAYLKRFPGNSVLTAKLAEVVVSLNGESPELTSKLAVAIEEALNANWVDRALELAKPESWKILREGNSVDYGLEMKQTAAKVEEDADAFFIAATRWNHLFVATNIQKVDADTTATIEPLSLIRLDQAYQQYKSAPSAKKLDVASLKSRDGFSASSQTVQLNASAAKIVDVKWHDWNVDLKPELLVATDQSVSLHEIVNFDAVKFDSKEPIVTKPLFSIDIDARVLSVDAIDLFEVKSAMRKEVDPRASVEGSMAFQEALHTTMKDIVVSTEAGLRVIATSFDRDSKSLKTELLKSDDLSLPSSGRVTQLKTFDIEADGDLDLVAVIDNQLRIFTNFGARRFLDASQFSDLPESNRSIQSIVCVDYDRDVDVDIIVSFADGVGQMENIQHGQFIFRELDQKWNALANAQAMIAAEIDGNVSWDFIGWNNQGMSLLRTTTVPGKSIAILDSSSVAFDGVIHVAVSDFNIDGKNDLAVFHAGGSTYLWSNNGEVFGFDLANNLDGKFDQADITYIVPPSNAPWIVASAKESIQLQQITPAKSDYVSIRMKGIADTGGGNNNEYSIGTTLELFTTRGYQSAVINTDTTFFGVGPDNDVYSLRTIFPNGLTQTIVDPETNTLLEKKQILKGSCPFLYGWDGKQWQLVTDLLWNAPLGLQVAKGVTLPDRRWEYLLLPRELMIPHDGALELRITEELWEAAYFDQVALFAYDHPADTSVASNEKVGPPTIAQPGLWSFAKSIPAMQVVDRHGRDWTSQLAQVDGVVATAWTQYLCQGLVDPYSIDLQIPQDVERDNAQLVLRGWIYPTDTGLNIGIDQDASLAPPMPPKLLAIDANGNSKVVYDFMGFPGGKPKTIVVDLANKIDANTVSLRIESSAEIYWDAAAFTNSQFIDVESFRSIELASANLQYRGFSELMPRQRSQPHWYDYDRVSTQPRWQSMDGLFTRYGNCKSIVADDDDRMVVMGSGDELIVRFSDTLPVVEEGYVRDFILKNVGWDKDADLNTITGQSSLPLPFKAMNAYPASVDQRAEQAAVDSLNQDTLTRTQVSKDFWTKQTSQ
jgi:hypothetical protein